MNRRATLPNRQDTNRRDSPHDLAASATSMFDLLSECGVCRDCWSHGSVTDCGLCPRGSPYQWSSSLPNVEQLLTGNVSIQSAILTHAAGCTWETDTILINCGGYTADEFFWTLNVNGTAAGGVELVFQKIAGIGCPDITIVYRNLFPWNCLCSNLMVLSRDEVDGVEPSLLPCTVCLRPVGCKGFPDKFLASLSYPPALTGDHELLLDTVDQFDVVNDAEVFLHGESAIVNFGCLWIKYSSQQSVGGGVWGAGNFVAFTKVNVDGIGARYCIVYGVTGLDPQGASGWYADADFNPLLGGELTHPFGLPDDLSATPPPGGTSATLSPA